MGVDINEPLVRQATSLCAQHFPSLQDTVSFRLADVLSSDFADESNNSLGQFDVIHVGTGLTQPPTHWLPLMKPGAVVLAPVCIHPQGVEQRLMRFRRVGAQLEEDAVLMSCVYSLAQGAAGSAAPEADQEAEELSEAELSALKVQHAAELQIWVARFKQVHERAPRREEIEESQPMQDHRAVDARLKALLRRLRARTESAT